MSEKYEGVKRKRKEIFVNNLMGGFAWGLGATIGLSLLIALLGFLAQYIDFVPIIGNFVSDIIDFIIKKQASLIMPFIWRYEFFA